MRTSLKEDLGCSTAEIVYGATLRLPGEFLVPSSNETDAGSFAGRLKSHMSKLRPVPTSTHRKPSFYIPKSLRTATHVFIRNDAYKTPLQKVYNGPFPVLERSEKTFKVDLGSRQDTVSLDRLKTAFIDCSSTDRPVLSPEWEQAAGSRAKAETVSRG